ncbi:hypothetical protein CBR_g24448 [Chara braunii]|uniref:Uncharacterized protein n=1 Tax=Chara braunii TaxID=69332 RepID=A0A388JMW6_CHABU|nr:hypothetical protein CBR_g24448 [Chara braunii]|eukprot:GBG59105.1 hypothetical protein CBR_g24448 [Chara braunii]
MERRTCPSSVAGSDIQRWWVRVVQPAADDIVRGWDAGKLGQICLWNFALCVERLLSCTTIFLRTFADSALHTHHECMYASYLSSPNAIMMSSCCVREKAVAATSVTGSSCGIRTTC